MLVSEHLWSNITPLQLLSLASLVSCMSHLRQPQICSSYLAKHIHPLLLILPLFPLLTSFNSFFPPVRLLYTCPPNLMFSSSCQPQSVGFHVPSTSYHLCHGSGWPALLLPGPCQREESPYYVNYDCRGYVW